MEESKGGMGNNTKNGKEYWWWKEHHAGKGQWFRHKPEYHGKWVRTSLGYGASTTRNKNLTLTKDFKDVLLANKEQNYVQSFMSQFKLDPQGNK